MTSKDTMSPASSAPSSLRRHQKQSSTSNDVMTTPQMLVLGRDGCDLEQSRGHNVLMKENGEANEDSKGSHNWWGVFNSKKSEVSHDSLARYTSMEEQEDASENNFDDDAEAPSIDIRRLILADQKEEASKILFKPLTPSLTATIDEHENISAEDAVRQDCSFFYHDMDDEQDENPLSLLDGSGASVPNPRARAAYRARFQQLNEDRHINNEANYHDLWFEEEENEPHVASTSPRITDVAKSSLCWYQDGKILMKLPKDKVRLVMDPDLEPGILSVEYSGSFKQNRSVGTKIALDEDKVVNNEIMYVFTVDDNLYRRVIGELSDSLSSQFGLNQFCIEEGHVHISVAILLLAVIFIFLIVNTIIWPVN